MLVARWRPRKIHSSVRASACPLASVRRNGKREQALKAMMNDQLRRALLAFPDEDVLIGTRMIDPGAFGLWVVFE